MRTTEVKKSKVNKLLYSNQERVFLILFRVTGVYLNKKKEATLVAERIILSEFLGMVILSVIECSRRQ